MDGMTCRIDGDIWAALKIVTYPYLADVENDEVIICKEILTDFDVISVITMERSFDVDPLTRLSEDVLKKFHLLIPFLGRKIVVFIYLALISQTFFFKSVHPCLIRQI